MNIDERWAFAFAQQALADLDIYRILAQTDAPPFASLHFLQMAAEKTCKAYRLRDDGYARLPFSHCLIVKLLPNILKDVLLRTQAWKLDRITAYLRHIGPLLADLEALAPACDFQGARPDNTEYPWIDSSRTIQYPAVYSFRTLQGRDRQLTQLVKLKQTALRVLLQKLDPIS